jgi:hypothetical protein
MLRRPHGPVYARPELLGLSGGALRACPARARGLAESGQRGRLEDRRVGRDVHLPRRHRLPRGRSQGRLRQPRVHRRRGWYLQSLLIRVEAQGGGVRPRQPATSALAALATASGHASAAAPALASAAISWPAIAAAASPTAV